MAVSLPHYSLELVEELNQTSQALGYDAARMGTTLTKACTHAHTTPSSPALRQRATTLKHIIEKRAIDTILSSSSPHFRRQTLVTAPPSRGVLGMGVVTHSSQGGVGK